MYLRCLFQQTGGITAIMFYAPKILTSAGMDGKSDILYITSLIGFTKTVVSVVCAILLDHKWGGRRRLLIISTCGLTCSILFLIIGFKTNTIWLDVLGIYSFVP
eukprot:UN05367